MITTYLWHPAAIVVAWTVVGDAEGISANFVRLAIVAIGTAVAVAAVGWLEDGGRPTSRQLLGGASLLIVGVGLAPAVAALADDTEERLGARVPSFRQA